jgi:hypothetical protein
MNEAFSSAGSLGTIFDEPDDTDRLARVINGIHNELLPVSGSTVGEIRARFRHRFDIDPRSVSILDSHEVNDATLVQPGQVLTFVHFGGGKGLR